MSEFQNLAELKTYFFFGLIVGIIADRVYSKLIKRNWSGKPKKELFGDEK